MLFYKSIIYCGESLIQHIHTSMFIFIDICTKYNEADINAALLTYHIYQGVRYTNQNQRILQIYHNIYQD